MTDNRYRRTARTFALMDGAPRLRAKFARELSLLAQRDCPPIRAAAAANWTLTAPPAPDELIDVWVALDDWLEAGKPEKGPMRFDGSSDPRNPYVRLICALTGFDTYLRGCLYGARMP